MPELPTFKFLAAGAIFGLTAGISPGPLLALVITESLKHNRLAGIKIAISPLITDLPIIIITLFVFNLVSDSDKILGLISITGSTYLLYLAYKTMKINGYDMELQNSGRGSLVKGMVANLLNPHPYLFWATIGSPYINKALEINLYTVILFLLSFYGLLLGSKIIIAIISDKSKTFINQSSFTWILRVLGIALFIFAVLFFYDGLRSVISGE